MTQTSPRDSEHELMSYEPMQALLNDTFHLSDGSEVTLVEVEKIVQKQPAIYSWQKPKSEPDKQPGRCTPFTLVFRFPADYPIQQGMYSVTHPTAGAFEGIFLVPIAQDEEGLYFEAVFN